MRGDEPPLTRFDVRSRDPEFAHDVLRESFLDFSVSPTGGADDFEFSQEGVAAAQFTRAHVRYRMHADLETGPEPGPVIVETLWNGRMTVDSGGAEVRPPYGVPVLFPTDVARTHGYRIEDIDVDALVLDRAVLHRTASCLFGIDPCELRFHGRTPASSAASTHFDRAVAHVDTNVLDDDEIASAPLVMAEATRILATAILLTFPNSGLCRTEEGEQEGWAAPAVLRRALAYIEEHADEDIGVDDIAAGAGVGVHGLQLLFRRHRNRTPIEELRRVRLARAHLDLQGADPGRGDTVAAVAARWGFSDADRFTVQYRPTYGCTPDETLRR